MGWKFSPWWIWCNGTKATVGQWMKVGSHTVFGPAFEIIWTMSVTVAVSFILSALVGDWTAWPFLESRPITTTSMWIIFNRGRLFLWFLVLVLVRHMTAATAAITLASLNQCKSPKKKHPLLKSLYFYGINDNYNQWFLDFKPPSENKHQTDNIYLVFSSITFLISFSFLSMRLSDMVNKGIEIFCKAPMITWLLLYQNILVG